MEQSYCFIVTIKGKGKVPVIACTSYQAIDKVYSTYSQLYLDVERSSYTARRKRV